MKRSEHLKKEFSECVECNCCRVVAVCCACCSIVCPAAKIALSKLNLILPFWSRSGARKANKLCSHIWFHLSEASKGEERKDVQNDIVSYDNEWNGFWWAMGKIVDFELFDFEANWIHLMKWISQVKQLLWKQSSIYFLLLANFFFFFFVDSLSDLLISQSFNLII